MSSTTEDWLTEVVAGGLTRREWILIGTLGGAVFICLIVILVLLIIMAKRRPRRERRVRRGSSYADFHEFDDNLDVWDHKEMRPPPRRERHNKHRDDKYHDDRQYDDRRRRDHHGNGHVNYVSGDYALAPYKEPAGRHYGQYVEPTRVERRYDDAARVHHYY